MHGSHVPVQAWLRAAYLVARMPDIDARGLERHLGRVSTRTVRFMLDRLQKAMVDDAENLFSDLIEAGEP